MDGPSPTAVKRTPAPAPAASVNRDSGVVSPTVGSRTCTSVADAGRARTSDAAVPHPTPAISAWPVRSDRAISEPAAATPPVFVEASCSSGV
jgi:hypothetical protein